MKQYKGAIFTDVDGTLVDERERIYTTTPKVKEALLAMQEKGYLIGVATGRSRCYIPDLGFDFDCYISANGAVADVAGENIFFDEFDKEELKMLISELKEKNIGYVLENADRCYYLPHAHDEIMQVLDRFHINRKVFHPIETEDLSINTMMLTFASEEQAREIIEEYKDRYLITTHRDGSLSGDLGKRHMNKSVGIRAVIERLGIDIKDTYAFGDHDNDIEMLEAVGHGIAMTPHSEGVHRVAEYVAKSVKEDGIYWGLKHYGLL